MDRDEKTSNTKEKIMEAAFSLFARKGYEASTLQDIMDMTHLSKGAIYHHYKSKQDILESMTKYAQFQMNAFLNQLVTDDLFTSREKISKIIEYTIKSDSQKQLISCDWVEKIPFSLLDEIRNLNNQIAPYISEIIEQGVKNKEYTCAYPREVAEIILLCIDIWLDPVIFRRTYQEVCSRLDFLAVMLEKLDASILDARDINKIKEYYKNFCK